MRVWSVFAGGVLLICASADMPAQPNKIATVGYVEGRVLILRWGSTVPESAELGMTLMPGDQVKTINGKCQLNVTAGGILRMSPNTTLAFPTRDREDELKASVILRRVGARWLVNARQVLQLDPEEPFMFPEQVIPPDVEPAPPSVVAQRAKEDQERLAAERGRAPARPATAGSDDAIAAEYRSLLPAVLEKEKKPWHTRFVFIANVVNTGAGYRVAYQTYCKVETGPDAGKDYACYEFDSVLDVSAMKAAVADMKQRLGR